MSFKRPLQQIPDIQPHTTAFILIGPFAEEADVYSVSVTPAGVFCASPQGRGGVVTRHEAMRSIVETFHALAAGTAHLHDPFMLWFRPGVDFRGTDEHAYNIMQGMVRAFCDYHTVRSRGYKYLAGQLEERLTELSSDTSVDGELLAGWERQVAMVQQLAEREKAYTVALKSLAHAGKLYGNEGSMVAAYTELSANHSSILSRYE